MNPTLEFWHVGQGAPPDSQPVRTSPRLARSDLGPVLSDRPFDRQSLALPPALKPGTPLRLAGVPPRVLKERIGARRLPTRAPAEDLERPFASVSARVDPLGHRDQVAGEPVEAPRELLETRGSAREQA